MLNRPPPIQLRVWNRLYDLFIDRLLHRNRDKHYLVHYINLSERKDRDKKIRAQLDAIGLPHFRFNACKFNFNDPTENELQILEQGISQYIYKYPKRVQRGIIGCYISHVGVLAKLDPNEERTQFIFEDDITLVSPLFFARATRSLKDLPEDWEICIFDAGGGLPNIDRISYYIWRPQDAKPMTYIGTHALAVNMKHRKRLLQKLRNYPIKDYDTLLADKSAGINSYVVQTNCISVEWFNEDSDIRNAHDEHLTEQ